MCNRMAEGQVDICLNLREVCGPPLVVCFVENTRFNILLDIKKL